jgi:hypothetical protein
VATYPTSSAPSGSYRPSKSFLAGLLTKSKQTPVFTNLRDHLTPEARFPGISLLGSS